jgi:hypothetical protein
MLYGIAEAFYCSHSPAGPRGRQFMHNISGVGFVESLHKHLQTNFTETSSDYVSYLFFGLIFAFDADFLGYACSYGS